MLSSCAIELGGSKSRTLIATFSNPLFLPYLLLIV